jgi:ABC-type polysaccharide/polyol phosphate export permease
MVVLLRQVRAVFGEQLLRYRGLKLVYATGVLEPLFFLVVFGVVLARAVPTSVDAAGTSYQSYVVAGCTCVAAMIGSSLDMTHDVVLRLRHTGFYRQVYQASTATVTIVVAEILWATVRGVAYMVVTLFVGVLFLPTMPQGPFVLLACGVGVVTSAFFASLFFFVCCFLRSVSEAGVLELVLSVLVFGSGIFFPLRDAPSWFSDVFEWSPLAILASFHRSALAGRGVPALAVVFVIVTCALILGAAAQMRRTLLR